jgi:hypothetical protein
MFSPSSWVKNKASMNQVTRYLLHAGFSLGLFLNPEDEGDMFL